MTDKSQALSNGKEALTSFDEVGSTSYEGGDGGEDTPWHSDYRVWPAEGYTKTDIADACENHYNSDYMLSPSMTDEQHDYIYITIRTL